jgi:long-chain fatty acid transport protein
MSTSRKSIAAVSALTLVLAAGTASATNGYYTHGLGTKNKALAGAGSADPAEPMIMATNPAGIAYVQQSVDVGLGLFSPMRDYKTSESLANGGCSEFGCAYTIGPNNLSSKNELFFVPYVASSWALSDSDYFGASFYGRGGMNTKWEGGTATYDPYFGMNPESGPTTFDGTYGGGTAGVDLMQGFINLSYARKFSDAFSLGVSGIIAIQRFEARGVANYAPFTKTFAQSGGTKMPKHLSGNGHDMSYGYGASVGLQWSPVDMFSIAAAYTTEMRMTDFSEYSDLFAEKGGFNMPATGTIGVAFKPTDRWSLMFDVQEIWYSDIDSVANSIDNIFSCPTLNPASTSFDGCLGGKKGAGFGWDDMTVYKLGAAWRYSDHWTFRGGYSKTDQPIPKSEMTFNILAPGVMEEHWTAGFSMTGTSGNELSVSFMYAPEYSISGPQNFDPTQNVKLSMKQYELEVSYSWKR